MVTARQESSGQANRAVGGAAGDWNWAHVNGFSPQPRSRLACLAPSPPRPGWGTFSPRRFDLSQVLVDARRFRPTRQAGRVWLSGSAFMRSGVGRVLG